MKLNVFSDSSSEVDSNEPDRRRRELIRTGTAALVASALGPLPAWAHHSGLARQHLENLPSSSPIAQHLNRHPAFKNDMTLAIANLLQSGTHERFDDFLSTTRPTFSRDVRAFYAKNKTDRDQVERHFATTLAPENYGLYVDGQTYTTYLMLKQADGQIIPVKRYYITISQHGFSNESGSEKSPIGAQRMTSRIAQPLGAVASLNPGPEGYFKRGDLVPSLGWSQPVSENPAWITTRFLRCDESRGLGFHGTNREWNHAGVRHMRVKASTGCFRMTNIDIADLDRYYYRGMPIYITAA